MYQPIREDGKHLRLLRIRPGQGLDMLECTLQHANLDEHPVYETISYCWGDANSKEQALVDGILVSLPASSGAALRRVRLPAIERIVWIDAICINQNDLDERSQQILLMRDIYARGKQGLVYLGEQDLTEAFHNVRDICSETSDDSMIEMNIKYAETREFQSRRTFRSQYNNSALVDLFSNEWFWRAWTWQEAILPQKSICLCGSAEIALLDIARAGLILQFNTRFIDVTLNTSISRVVDYALQIDPLYRNGGFKITGRDKSFGHMRLMHKRRCTIAVDRVYGILGICPGLKIIPDYRKPQKDVFEDAFRAIIAEARSLSMMVDASRLLLLDYCSDKDIAQYHHLLLASERQGPDSRSPSWVPPWHRLCGRRDVLVQSFAGRLDACKGRTYRPHLYANGAGEQPGILRVQGVRVGRIIRKAIWYPDVQHHLDFPSFFDEAEDLAADASSVQSATSVATLEKQQASREREVSLVLGSCMLASHTNDSTETVGRYQAFKRISQMLQRENVRPISADSAINEQIIVELRQKGINVSNSDAEWQRAILFNTDINQIVASRKLFIIDTGLFAIGPVFVAEGDVVVVLNGLDRLAILRPLGDKYVFIGVAYAYGIMQGEIIERHEQDGGEDETFDLC